MLCVTARLDVEISPNGHRKTFGCLRTMVPPAHSAIAGGTNWELTIGEKSSAAMGSMAALNRYGSGLVRLSRHA